jgi:hypothetical protein
MRRFENIGFSSVRRVRCWYGLMVPNVAESTPKRPQYPGSLTNGVYMQWTLGIVSH